MQSTETRELNAGLQIPRVKNAAPASPGFGGGYGADSREPKDRSCPASKHPLTLIHSGEVGSMAPSCLLTNPSSSLDVKSLTHSPFLLTLEAAAMYSHQNRWGAANYENHMQCYRSVNCAEPSCMHPGTSCHSPDDSVHHHGSRDATRIQFE